MKLEIANTNHAAQKIFQCGLCNRATDAKGHRLDHQPTAQEFVRAFLGGCDFYEQLVCVVCRENPPKDEPVVVRSVKPKAQNARPSCAPAAIADLPPNPRGCPSDDARFVTSNLTAEDVLDRCDDGPAPERGADFSPEAHSQNEMMLEEFFKTFDPSRFNPLSARPDVRSAWISNSKFARAPFFIPRPNSRASQLNGSRTLEPHPLIKRWRLRVDCRVNDQGEVERSLCFVEHSRWWKRKAEMHQGQRELNEH